MTKLVNQIIKDYLDRDSLNHTEKTVEELKEKLNLAIRPYLPAQINKF